jgi:general secretion pathway protein G
MRQRARHITVTADMGTRGRTNLMGSGAAAFGPSTEGSRRRSGAVAGGFTLIEILIVVVILGILAAVVLPKFSDASHTARENALKDDLRYLRTQVTVFKAQHRDVPPGYPSGNRSAAPTAATFVDQMTKQTDERCGIGSTPAHKLGPYFQNMPPNPLNQRSTILVVPDGAAMPAPDDSTGWIYKPSTMELVPNLTGTDSEGRPYAQY